MNRDNDKGRVLLSRTLFIAIVNFIMLFVLVGRSTLQRYGIRTPLVKGFTKFFRSFFRFFRKGENVCLETPSRCVGEGCVGRSVSRSVV